MTDYKAHRYAEFLPLPNEEGNEELMLRDSLIQNGMLTPIMLFEGMILDGRRRYRAYLRYPDKINLSIAEFPGTDDEALEYVAASINRREFTAGQRALFAWRFFRAQRKTFASKEEAKTYAQMKFNTSIITLDKVGTIGNNRDQDVTILLDAIGNGFPVKTALKIMKELPEVAWSKAVGDGTEEDSATADDLLKKQRQQIAAMKNEPAEQERKAANKARDAANKAAANGDAVRYPVILLDPPSSMPMDELRALAVPMADDCAVFLWSQRCELASKLEILQGWGLDYQIVYVWYEPPDNDGELLLLAKRGNPPKIVQPMTMAYGAKSKGAKPPIFKDGITKMFPTSPKFDMFGVGQNNAKGNGWYYEQEPSSTLKLPSKSKRKTPVKIVVPTATNDEQPTVN